MNIKEVEGLDFVGVEAEPEARLPAVAPPITAQKVAVRREIAHVLSNIRELAAMAGDDWFYRYSVRSGSGVEWIEGPSIKCANAVARVFGNCQIDTRVVDSFDNWMIYARFVDLETGFSYTRPFQQRKDQRAMRTDRGRGQDMALQIGVSKAIRNVVCNALETFTTFAFEEARKNMVEKVGRNLDDYRERVLDRLNEMEVDVSRVERVIGRASANWVAGDVARIVAQIQAIKDGMATIDETWPQPEGEKTAHSDAPKDALSALKDRMAEVRQKAQPVQDVEVEEAGGPEESTEQDQFPHPHPEEDAAPVASEPPQGDEFWAADTWTVAIPEHNNRKDWRGYAADMKLRIDECLTSEMLAKLMADNQNNLQAFSRAAGALADDVRAHYAKRNNQFLNEQR